MAEHEARGEHFKWADRKWRRGKKSRKTDEEAGDTEETVYAEDTGYATEDKLNSEPDSPVAIGFPPGTAVERTIDGRLGGEE